MFNLKHLIQEIVEDAGSRSDLENAGRRLEFLEERYRALFLGVSRTVEELRDVTRSTRLDCIGEVQKEEARAKLQRELKDTQDRVEKERREIEGRIEQERKETKDKKLELNKRFMEACRKIAEMKVRSTNFQKK